MVGRFGWICGLRALENGGGQVQQEESGGEEDSTGGEGDAIEPLRWFHEPPSRGTSTHFPNVFFVYLQFY